MELQMFWETIQAKICPRCLDGDSAGTCKLPFNEECALKTLLPQIVMTVANVKSNSMDAYVASLRRNVCILCDHQTSEMKCNHRKNLECALDRYYPLVVNIIESIRSEQQFTQASGTA